jgi:hypothetical protein
MQLATVLMGLAAMAVSLPATTINFAGLGALGISQTFGATTANGYFSNSTPKPV